MSSWKKKSQTWQEFSVSFSQARRVNQEKTIIQPQIVRLVNSK
jgi:hypothetical protein